MIAVLGSGSWATEIVHILQQQSPAVINWWVRNDEKADVLQGMPRVKASSNIAEVIDRSDDIFLVIPSAYVCSALNGIDGRQLAGKNIISATKAFLVDNDGCCGDKGPCALTVTSYFERHYGVPPERLCVVSGPSHAEEVARGMLTYLNVASSNTALVEHVRDLLACDWICTKSAADRVGLECAAALKNVYAIASGLCTSLEYGDNLLAVLIAAACREMAVFIARYTADGLQRDMSGYLYLSDLLATAYSPHSRNRTLGELLGRGYSVYEARLMQKMVAEGYYTAKHLEALRSLLGIEMPIAQAVYRILYKGCDARREMQVLTHSLV